MTTDTTSAGMPPIAPVHDALDMPSATAPMASKPTPQAVHSLVGEGKAQIASGLGGVVEAIRDIASKLDDNGASPVAKYIHDAADTVAGWHHAVERKSVDDLVGDAKTLVRTSPALAVGLAVAAGFVVSRVVRSGR